MITRASGIARWTASGVPSVDPPSATITSIAPVCCATDASVAPMPAASFSAGMMTLMQGLGTRGWGMGADAL